MSFDATFIVDIMNHHLTLRQVVMTKSLIFCRPLVPHRTSGPCPHAPTGTRSQPHHRRGHEPLIATQKHDYLVLAPAPCARRLAPPKPTRCGTDAGPRCIDSPPRDALAQIYPRLNPVRLLGPNSPGIYNASGTRQKAQSARNLH